VLDVLADRAPLPARESSTSPVQRVFTGRHGEATAPMFVAAGYALASYDAFGVPGPVATHLLQAPWL
jgi:hypothetical protein